MRLLLVEDDERIGAFVQKGLAQDGQPDEQLGLAAGVVQLAQQRVRRQVARLGLVQLAVADVDATQFGKRVGPGQAVAGGVGHRDGLP